MKRFPLWIFLLLIVTRGQPSAHPSTPVVDPRHWAFHSEEVTVDTGAVTLTGTLLTPPDKPTAPAVIIIPGSGPATRNGSWNMYRHI